MIHFLRMSIHLNIDVFKLTIDMKAKFENFQKGQAERDTLESNSGSLLFTFFSIP